MKKGLFYIAVLLLLPLGSAQAVRFITKPYLQNLKTDEVTIMWIADDANGMQGWVEYSQDGSVWHKAYQRSHGLITAYERINRVRVTSLNPGTQYQYRVAEVAIKNVTDTSLVYGDTIYSTPYQFTTIADNAPTVSCKIFNDLHDNHTLFEMLMKLNVLPDYDFVFFNGDMLNMTPSEMNIQTNLITPCTKLFATERPLMMVRGNHEVRREYARKYFDYFQLGDNNTGYYTFEWGPCFFIVLDCGEDAEDVDPNNLFAFDDYRDMQTHWLAQVLQSEPCRKATYRVILQHVPTYTNTSKERHAMLYAREHWQPLFHEYGVDVVIAGHTHKPGIYPADSNHHYPLVIGGGNDTSKGASCPPTMTTLEASQYAMTIKIYNLAGKVLHSIVVENKGNLPSLSGELDLLRIGDGQQQFASHTAHPLFIDRYTLSERKAECISSIALPAVSSGVNHACLGVTSAMQSNYLTRSDDNGYLLIGGYATETGNNPIKKTASQAPRVIASVDWMGNVNTTTAVTSANMDSCELQYVLSSNGQTFTLATSQGVMETTIGSNTATVNTSEIPPASGYTLTLHDGTMVRYEITGANDITKSSFVDGQWVLNGTFSEVTRPHQLVARQADGCIEVFVVSAVSSSKGSSRLVLVEDIGGYNAPMSGLISTLAEVSGENKALLGISFCPVQPTTSVPDSPTTDSRQHTFSIQNGQIIIDNMYNAIGQKIR